MTRSSARKSKGRNMEALLFLVFLVAVGWVAFKALPYLFKGAWFLILFVGALVVFVGAKIFMDVTNLGLIVGCVAAVVGAWAFAKRKFQ